MTDFLKIAKSIVVHFAHICAYGVETVKSMDTSCKIYPSREQMADSEAALKYIPETLQELLRVLFTGKGYGIGTSINWTAIMQGTSPKVILAPSQFGLASQMHHKLHLGSLLIPFTSMDLDVPMPKS